MSTGPSMVSMIARIMAAAMLVNPVAAAKGPMQFPKKLEDVELDIVGLLAVVGEWSFSVRCDVGSTTRRADTSTGE